MRKSNRIKKREMKTKLSRLMALPCGALVPSSTSWFQQKTLSSYIFTIIILSNLIIPLLPVMIIILLILNILITDKT